MFSSGLNVSDGEVRTLNMIQWLGNSLHSPSESDPHRRCSTGNKKMNVTTECSAGPLVSLDDYFVQLLETWRKCVGVKAEYFEVLYL
jgi:hypothetical protein